MGHHQYRRCPDRLTHYQHTRFKLDIQLRPQSIDQQPTGHAAYSRRLAVVNRGVIMNLPFFPPTRNHLSVDGCAAIGLELLLAAFVGSVCLSLPSPAGAQSATSLQWLCGGHGSTVNGVAYSPDGRMMVSASDDSTIKFWSTNGALVRTLTTYPYRATALAFSPDGINLLVGTALGQMNGTGQVSGQTILWQAPSGWLAANVTPRRTNTDHLGKVTAVAFSKDGANYVSAGAEGSNVVRQVNTGLLVRQVAGYNTGVGPAAVNSVAFSPAGFLASGCEDSTICVWDAAGNQVWSTQGGHASNVTAVAFSPEGSKLASGSLDASIKIWSTNDWSLLLTLSGHTQGVTSLGFLPDAATLASGSLDRNVKLWNVSSGDCVATSVGHSDGVTSVAGAPNGLTVVSGSGDNTVKTWSAADGTLVQNISRQADCVNSVAISPDGAMSASMSNDNSIQVRRLLDGLLLQTLAGHTDWISAITFSPDSAALASGGGALDPSIKLWRLRDGMLLRTIVANSNGITALAFSPDGSTLAAGGDSTDKTITLWNVSDGSLQRTLAGHTNGVSALSFSPGGDALASGGRRPDNTVKLWQASSGNLIRTLTGHSGDIEALSYSPDGTTVAAGCNKDSDIKLFSVAAGTSRTFGSGTNPVTVVTFSPDGTKLASGIQDAISFWDVTAGTVSQTFTQETFQVSCFSYSPNGNLFIFGRQDATIGIATNSLGALGQPPLLFTSISAGAEGLASLQAASQPKTHYVIQSSTDLARWGYLTNAVSTTNSLQILDSLTNGATARFYRAITPP